MLSILTSHEILYDDVLTRRSEMPNLLKAFAVCNKVIILFY